MDWLDTTELEWSPKPDLHLLDLGEGAVFKGDATMALAKAILESGVSYIGGYQGAPVAYLMDCFAEASEKLDALGVHYQPCANEAAAAAMLGASINYPLRGVAIWKSVAGTGVATDALANLATAGVMGGTVIIVGADFGEGSNVGQERTLGSALKSQIWMIDPRPDLPSLVRLLKSAFALSEASNTPVIVELRIKATHLSGEFVASDNKAPAFSQNNPIKEPSRDYQRLVLPPATFGQEKDRIERRLPQAQEFIVENGMNEVVSGSRDDVGIILQGGHYNAVQAALRDLELASVFGESQIPMLVLNVTNPLVPQQLVAFCKGRRNVLVVEEGHPAYIEDALSGLLRESGLDTKLSGKDVLSRAGEYTADLVFEGVRAFVGDCLGWSTDALPEKPTGPNASPLKDLDLVRPPGFCTGCPERPVFTALKLLERESGPFHMSCDIGCSLYSTLPPFDMGQTVLGYGLGLASSAGVEPNMKNRVISTMGDGAFWHNGLSSSVSGAVSNDDDSVLVVFDNGYTSSTGAQSLPSSPHNRKRTSIASALRGIGVGSIARVRSYSVSKVRDRLRAALNGDEGGLKVIIAEGECQLAIQRRNNPVIEKKKTQGAPYSFTRFGVDDETCTGDHECIRLSGCPSLTVKDNPDMLRNAPVTHVSDGCVGCGLCGEAAHAAVLCPSFYRVNVRRNAGHAARFLARLRGRVIAWLSPRPRVARTEG